MPGIFISYRRDDSSGYAGRLRERLIQRFGRDNVFLDIDDIPVGQDFVSVIGDRVASCGVVVVLIGKAWATLQDSSGRRRLDDPADFVRLEIFTALERGVAIVPVLVAGARMPSPDELPGPIRRLAYVNAFELNDRFFEESIERLTKTLAPYAGSAMSWHVPDRARQFTIIGAIVLMLAAIGMVSQWMGKPEPARQATNRTGKPEAPAKKQGKAPEIPVSPKVEDQIPIRISAPPPVVESARNAFEFGDAPAVEGPKNPKVLWQAVFNRESMHNWGVAGDGTLLLTTGPISYFPALIAIREGREQWAYKLKPQSADVELALDGRIWISQGEDRVLCFNTRGEGGRVENKDQAGWMSDILSARRQAHAFRQENRSSWECERDKLSGKSPGNYAPWTLVLDGDCVSSDQGSQGYIFAATEMGTIYSVTRTGQIRWTYKSDCKIQRIVSLSGDDAIGLCESSYFGLRNGRKQWSRQGPYSMPSPPDYSRGLLFDKSNTLYLREGELVVAINRDGQLIWSKKISGEPRLLDQKGRLYVGEGSTGVSGLFIACLGDL